MNPNRELPRRLATTVAAFALILSACSSPAANSTAPTGGTGASPSAAAAASTAACGTVNIAVNPWVGYEADAAVVSYVLQHQLGCTVVKKNIDEQTSWQGFPTGEVDAILENWGHDDLVAKYITADKTAQDRPATRGSSAGISRSSSPMPTRTS
jgi:glycine betaine/proline transport system substrate-binding protein